MYYDYDIEDLIFTLMPYYIIPVIILIARSLLRIVISIAKGECEETKENKEEIKETKNINDDLKKYFNYKE